MRTNLACVFAVFVLAGCDSVTAVDGGVKAEKVAAHRLSAAATSLYVEISGPDLYEYNTGDDTPYYGTWHSSVSGGTPPYTYSWRVGYSYGTYPSAETESSFTRQVTTAEGSFRLYLDVTSSDGKTGSAEFGVMVWCNASGSFYGC